MVDNQDFKDFQAILDKATKDNNLEKEEDLKDLVPDQNSSQHGKLAIVKLNGLSLTEKGEITKARFFENLEINNESYKDITLTADEAQSLALNYRALTTGVNAVVPITCTGSECPFASACWYQQNQKAPIGKPCPVEYHMLGHHTQKLFEQFDPDMTEYTDILLIQELAESIILEMRATIHLAQPENNQMMGHRIKFSPDGEQVEEEVIHWAYELKERIKNRRMKILDALNATRKNKAQGRRQDSDEKAPWDEMRDIMKTIKKISAQEVNFREDEG